MATAAPEILDVTETATDVASPAASLQGAVETIDFAALAHNPDTWIFVAFVIFVALAARYVMPVVGRALDSRSAQIRDQLEQAQHLREQAEALLASYQQERDAAAREAEAILATAKRDADVLRETAATDLKHAIERRTQQAMEKIARAEHDATHQIRTQMIDVATHAAHTVIRNELEAGGEDQAIDRAIRAIEQQIH